jgi:tetratricopeptide (TPR) repeat protein
MAEDSLADLENAVERGGSEAELRPLRAKLLLSLKRFDEAAEESRRGLEDDSTSHRIREILLDALIESGNDTDAVEVGREAVRDDLACAKCWRRYAAALTQSSSATTAVDAMGSQTLERAEEFVARADAYASVEFLDHARADIDMALRLDERLAIAWRVRGVIEGMSVATMPLAVEAFSRALEIDEDEIFAYYLRASAHNALDNLAEAEADLAETIRRRPTFASAYIDRARIRAKRSKDGVEDDLDKAVELDETHLLERIDFFLKSSRFEEALRDQVALVKIRPSVDHRNGIGLTLSYLGFYDEAIELFEACLSDDEGIALPVQYNLTVATVRRDGVTGAASELKRLDDAIASAHGDVDEDRIGYAEAGAAALRGERSQAITRLSQTLSRDGRVAADWARRDPAWEALRLDADVRDLLTL